MVLFDFDFYDVLILILFVTNTDFYAMYSTIFMKINKNEPIIK